MYFGWKVFPPYFAPIYAVKVLSLLQFNVKQFPVDTIRKDGNRFVNTIVKYVLECTLLDYGYGERDTMLRISVFFILFGTEHADIAVTLRVALQVHGSFR